MLYHLHITNQKSSSFRPSFLSHKTNHLVEEMNQITNLLLYYSTNKLITKQVIKQCGREEQEEENFNSVHCHVLARQAKKEK